MIGLLAACNGIGLGTNRVTPAVSDQKITVDLTFSESTGEPTKAAVEYESGKVTFLVPAGSAGVSITSFKSQLINEDGTPYVTDIQTGGLAVVASPKKVCPNNAETCNESDKVFVDNTVPAALPSSIFTGIGTEFTNDCVNECPKLKLRVEFYGTDQSTNQPIKLVAQDASIAVVRNVSTE